MCEFCAQHGEGKTWYLNAKNYSTDLLSELHRKNFIEHFYHEVVHKGQRSVSLLESTILRKIGLPHSVRSNITAQHKSSHFGQVVPLEDIEKILLMSNSITRINCGCRWAKEHKESRLCYGVSFGPPDWYEGLDMEFFGSPEVSRIENLTKEEAITYISEADKQGFVHSIWTFETPFIGAICNCDHHYCLAMRMTLGVKAAVMFRAEYVASITSDLCNGCRACAEKCQFNAIDYDETAKNCLIDHSKCYGCGVCRASCPENAISLFNRDNDPVAAQLW